MGLLSSRLAPLTVSVPAASGWTSYTPTGAITTNCTYTGLWRRVGENIELQISMLFSGANTQGALNFTEAQILNGLGLTIDTTKLAFAGPDYATSIGTWTSIDSGVTAANSGLVSRRQSGTIELVYPSSNTAAQAVNTASVLPFAPNVNDGFSIRVTLPITGWTSHTASATSANALVVGGQSVGSTLSFGATSNQGFSILANNVAAISSTAAGATTLTATSGQHVFTSPTYPSVSFRRGGGFGGFDIWGDAVGTNDKTIVDGAGGNFRIRNNDASVTGFQVTQTGAVTLGSTGNSLTHTTLGGNVSSRTTMGYATAGTYRLCFGPENNTNDNGFAKSWQLVVDKAAGAGAHTGLSFQVNTGFDSVTPFAIPTTNLVNTGGINVLGAWTLGPTGSTSVGLQHVFNTPVANSYGNITVNTVNNIRFSALATGTPVISSRVTSTNTTGLTFVTGTNDTNSAADMTWQVLESDNTDFATQSSLMYGWYNGAGAAIMTSTRAGAWTLGPTGFTGSHRINAGTSSSATAGGITSLPATVRGYLEMNINGTVRKIPFYDV